MLLLLLLLLRSLLLLRLLRRLRLLPPSPLVCWRKVRRPPPLPPPLPPPRARLEREREAGATAAMCCWITSCC